MDPDPGDQISLRVTIFLIKNFKFLALFYFAFFYVKRYGKFLIISHSSRIEICILRAKGKLKQYFALGSGSRKRKWYGTNESGS